MTEASPRGYDPLWLAKGVVYTLERTGEEWALLGLDRSLDSVCLSQICRVR